jgi:hypothetical protein
LNKSGIFPEIEKRLFFKEIHGFFFNSNTTFSGCYGDTASASEPSG